MAIAKVSRADVIRLKQIIRKAGGKDADLLEFLKAIWYEGYTDRIKEEQNAEKDDAEDLIAFKRGQDYLITCPHCGEDVLIDFQQMRIDSSKEAVEEVMDKTNWETKYKIRR